jgi:hypothetical protein
MAALTFRFHGSHAASMEMGIRPQPGALHGPARVTFGRAMVGSSSMRAMPRHRGVILLSIAISISITAGAGTGWHWRRRKRVQGKPACPDRAGHETLGLGMCGPIQPIWPTRPKLDCLPGLFSRKDTLYLGDYIRRLIDCQLRPAVLPWITMRGLLSGRPHPAGLGVIPGLSPERPAVVLNSCVG